MRESENTMAIKDIHHFTLDNRRLEYRLLRDFAKNTTLEEFINVIDHAVLTGSGLYNGKLDEHACVDQTMMFNKPFIDQDDDAEISIHSTIFYLGKTSPTDKDTNIITIGRAQKNDLVLDDNPISREHAHIRVANNQYFIKDFGATNGTLLNEKPLLPNQEQQLQAGDTLGFGRLQFDFMTPERFYRWVQKY